MKLPTSPAFLASLASPARITRYASRVLRTPHGKGRVSARRGRAGEKSDFFSILLNTRLRQVHLSEVLCFLPIAKPA